MGLEKYGEETLYWVCAFAEAVMEAKDEQVRLKATIKKLEELLLSKKGEAVG